jgi:hypothetical protein
MRNSAISTLSLSLSLSHVQNFSLHKNRAVGGYVIALLEACTMEFLHLSPLNNILKFSLSLSLSRFHYCMYLRFINELNLSSALPLIWEKENPHESERSLEIPSCVLFFF